MIDLKIIVKTYKIIPDTNSFMKEKSSKFYLENLMPLLKENKNKLYILASVLNEVEKNSNPPEKIIFDQKDIENQINDNKMRFSSEGRILKRLWIKSGVVKTFYKHNDNPETITYDEILERLKNEWVERTYYGRNAFHIIESLRNDGLVNEFGRIDETFSDPQIISILVQNYAKVNQCIITQDKNLADDINKINDFKSINTDKMLLISKLKKNGLLEEWYFNSKKKIQGVNRRHIARNNIKPFKKSRIVVDNKSFKIISLSSFPSEGSILYNSKGKEVRLNEEIDNGRGSEGVIYKCGKDVVCKIFIEGQLNDQKFQKIKLMFSNPIRYGFTWPLSILKNKDGQFVGYMMNEVIGKKLDDFIRSPKLLSAAFPSWGRIELVELAVKVLKRIARMHDINVVIGDIRPANIILDKNGIVNFVDTDSFQIEKYPCEVWEPEYTRPDLHGKDLKTFLRTFNHDYYAAAIVIFQILFLGKHPYATSSDSTVVDDMANMNFPYLRSNKRLKIAPYGRWRYIYSNLTYVLKDKFFRIFKYGEMISINEWINALNNYIYSLKAGNFSNELLPSHLKGKVSGDNYKCIRCDESFILTDEEKRYFRKMNFDLPKRCSDCRDIRKLNKESYYG